MTRHHAVKLSPTVQHSVKEAALALGDIESLKSASRVNGAIVIFVDTMAKVSELVDKGVVIQDTFTSVSPLSNPANKVMISNAPPFIKTISW